MPSNFTLDAGCTTVPATVTCSLDTVFTCCLVPTKSASDLLGFNKRSFNINQFEITFVKITN